MDTSLWLEGSSQAQTLAVWALIARVGQQAEGLGRAEDHLLQATSLIVSGPRFSLFSPQSLPANTSSRCSMPRPPYLLSTPEPPQFVIGLTQGCPNMSMSPPEEGLGSRGGGSSSQRVAMDMCLSPNSVFSQPYTQSLQTAHEGELVERNRFILMYKAVSSQDHIQQLHRILEKLISLKATPNR